MIRTEVVFELSVSAGMHGGEGEGDTETVQGCWRIGEAFAKEAITLNGGEGTAADGLAGVHNSGRGGYNRTFGVDRGLMKR